MQEQTIDQVVEHLKTAGIVIPRPIVRPNGLLQTLRNFSMRDKLWRLDTICFDGRRAGEFAICDERGQVFAVSMKRNEYHMIRHASSAISAMAFVTSRPKQLLLAYESGDIVIVDTINGENIAKTTVAGSSNHHVGTTVQTTSNNQPTDEEKNNSFVGSSSTNLTTPTKNSSTTTSCPECVRLVRIHPTKLLAVTAADDQVISLWDLASVPMRCLRRLPCGDNIIDVTFEFGGTALCVVLDGAGVCLYRTKDCSLAVQCVWPGSEPKPIWTGIITPFSLPSSTTLT